MRPIRRGCGVHLSARRAVVLRGAVRGVVWSARSLVSLSADTIRDEHPERRTQYTHKYYPNE